MGLVTPVGMEVDILVRDEEGKPLLIVETKRNIDRRAERRLETYARVLLPEFVMTAGPQEIRVAPVQDGEVRWDDSIALSTAKVTGRYGDIARLERAEEFYLNALIEAWLNDFALAWKSAAPPAHEELSRIGLAQRLRQSQVVAEARI